MRAPLGVVDSIASYTAVMQKSVRITVFRFEGQYKENTTLAALLVTNI